MSEIDMLVAVTEKGRRRFLKASASAEWVKAQGVDKPEEARAVVMEHAYHVMELNRVAGGGVRPASLHFNTTGIRGAGSLIPGMEPLGATSNWCCICNDANPPECACVPC